MRRCGLLWVVLLVAGSGCGGKLGDKKTTPGSSGTATAPPTISPSAAFRPG